MMQAPVPVQLSMLSPGMAQPGVVPAVTSFVPAATTHAVAAPVVAHTTMAPAVLSTGHAATTAATAAHVAPAAAVAHVALGKVIGTVVVFLALCATGLLVVLLVAWLISLATRSGEHG